jgi:hypothetical protein
MRTSDHAYLYSKLEASCTHVFLVFYFLGWGETEPTWYIGHYLVCCDDECVAIGGMRIGWEEPKYSEKTCPSATTSTTDPTWPDRSSNPDCHGGKLATNCLSYGMTLVLMLQALIRKWFTVSFLEWGPATECNNLRNVQLDIAWSVWCLLKV